MAILWKTVGSKWFNHHLHSNYWPQNTVSKEGKFWNEGYGSDKDDLKSSCMGSKYFNLRALRRGLWYDCNTYIVFLLNWAEMNWKLYSNWPVFVWVVGDLNAGMGVLGMFSLRRPNPDWAGRTLRGTGSPGLQTPARTHIFNGKFRGFSTKNLQFFRFYSLFKKKDNDFHLKFFKENNLF